MRKFILTGLGPGGSFPSPEPIVAAASDLLGRLGPIDRCILHVGTDAGLDAAAGWGPGDGGNVAMELWTGREDVRQALRRAPFDHVAIYEVEEIVEKGGQDFALGPIAGVTMFARNLPKPGLSAEQVRAGYDGHPAVALDVHFGMATYVRNWVLSAEPGDAEPLSSISVLYFPSEYAIVHERWNSPEGQQAVINDIAGFMDLDRILGMNARSFALR